MASLPVVGGHEAVRAFQKFGWTVARYGNHIILVKEEAAASLSIPDHKELAKGTLRKLIRLAGLTVEEFVSAL